MSAMREQNVETIKAHEAYMGSSVISEGRDTSADKLRQTDANKGRAATLNPSSRFDKNSYHVFDDGWQTLDELPPFKTHVQIEKPKTVITKNDSPDIGFDRSINPYRGCEHGCIYCFARPTHSFMGLSAGLDFETTLYAKPNAAQLLERELAKKNYKPRTIAIGTNTDPYQPIEKQWRVTREILEVLSRTMEPRAATPGLRLKTIRDLTNAGIPTSTMVAPVIPALTDHEIERILDSAQAAGATEAGFIMLRLPREVSPLFRDWLLKHYPDRYRHVMNLLRALRGGKDYDAEFGKRMRGDGPYAWQIGRRFEIACKKLGLNEVKRKLDHTQFVPPLPEVENQLTLF